MKSQIKAKRRILKMVALYAKVERESGAVAQLGERLTGRQEIAGIAWWLVLLRWLTSFGTKDRCNSGF
jgi:hypothetical protein